MIIRLYNQQAKNKLEMEQDTVNLLKDISLIIAVIVAIYGLYEKHLKKKLQQQIEEQREYFDKKEQENNQKLQDFYHKLLIATENFTQVFSEVQGHYYNDFKELKCQVGDDMKAYKSELKMISLGIERFKLEIVEVINRKK
jgi:hypothetical protein